MRMLIIFSLALLNQASLAQGVNVVTFHGDSARLGWNARETKLSHSSVNVKAFGKLWDTRLDGQVYGSPLHLSGIQIQARKRDVVFAATQRNSVYALDAETGEILWERKELAPPLDSIQYNQCPNIRPWHGITSTPVIDLDSRTIYVCGVTQPGIRPIYAL